MLKKHIKTQDYSSIDGSVKAIDNILFHNGYFKTKKLISLSTLKMLETQIKLSFFIYKLPFNKFSNTYKILKFIKN